MMNDIVDTEEIISSTTKADAQAPQNIKKKYRWCVWEE